jgi:hypothetical protein
LSIKPAQDSSQPKSKSARLVVWDNISFSPTKISAKIAQEVFFSAGKKTGSAFDFLNFVFCRSNMS